MPEGGEAQTSPTVVGGKQGPRWRARLTLLLLASALIVAGAAVLLPWWQVSSTLLQVGSPTRATAFWLPGLCSATACSGAPAFASMTAVFQVTAALEYIGLALGLASLAYLCIAGGRPALLHRSLGLRLCASLFLLLAPVNLYIALPWAFPPFFLPTIEFSGVLLSSPHCSPAYCALFAWGSSTGWWLSFVASAVLFGSALIALPFGFARRIPKSVAHGPNAEGDTPRLRAAFLHLRRILRRPRAPTLALILCAALIVTTLLLPWWSIASAGPYAGPGRAQQYYLYQRCSDSGCIVYAPFYSFWGYAAIFGVAFALVLAALALSLLTLGFFVLSSRRPGLAPLIPPTGLLLASFLAMAPAYLLFAGAEATSTDTFGSTAFFGSDAYSAWGADVGWYLAFLASVACLLATGYAASAARRRSDTPATVGATSNGDELSSVVPPAPSPRLGLRTTAPAVLFVLTIVIGAVSISTMWYGVWTFSVFQAPTLWHLGFVCSRGVCVNYQGAAAALAAFGLTSALVWAGLGLAFLSLGFMILAIVRPRFARFVAVAGMAGSVLFLVAPIYLFSAMAPGAASAASGSAISPAFFGPYWGPGAGWWMAFLASGTSSIGTILAAAAQRHLEERGDLAFRFEGTERRVGIP